MKCFYSFLFTLLCASAMAQHAHFQSARYEYPTDSLVLRKLEQWRDQKFGVIIHWGIYAVPGIIESWAICSEEWIGRDNSLTYEQCKRQYWDYARVFNPSGFDPEQWADAAQAAGMKYLVFTTKHHDGFCMFDSHETDFTIAKGPFASHPKADVAKHVFEAFRNRGLMIGAYFSKPDWHSQYYWWDKYATPDRNNNYDIRKHPWRWKKFKEFTYNQIRELMQHYGSIDILWLDGGWVRPLDTVTDEVRSWGARIPEWSQDIDMPWIAAMAREAQPGLLIVDRTVHGPYENYQTPEQKIPESQLDYPWETCMTLGHSWGWTPHQHHDHGSPEHDAMHDHNKPAAFVIHCLAEIVAKGGNLLLGFGPTPDGLLPEDVVERLHEIGQWTQRNGKAIYNTRNTPHYHDGQTWFTESRDGRTVYAIHCVDEHAPASRTVRWKGNLPAKGSKVILLHTGKAVKWKTEGDEVVVRLPAGLPPKLPAYAFEMKKGE
jgi:alpha-L-fucosidase